MNKVGVQGNLYVPFMSKGMKKPIWSQHITVATLCHSLLPIDDNYSRLGNFPTLLPIMDQTPMATFQA